MALRLPDGARRPAIGCSKAFVIRYVQWVWNHMNYWRWNVVLLQLWWLITALWIWGAATEEQDMTFHKAAYMAMSAVTVTGLNSIAMSVLNLDQQIALFGGMLFGSYPFCNFCVLVYRFIYLWYTLVRLDRSRFDPYEKRKWGMRRWLRKKVVSKASHLLTRQEVMDEPVNDQAQEVPAFHSTEHVVFEEPRPRRSISLPNHSGSTSGHTSGRSDDDSALPASLRRRPSASSAASISSAYTHMTREHDSRIDRGEFGGNGAWIARNSNIQDMTPNDYFDSLYNDYRCGEDAIGRLLRHCLFWIFLAVVVLKWYHLEYSTWFAVSTSLSALVNAGLTYHDDGMTRFQADNGLLFVIGLVMLAGFTALPVCQRLDIWCDFRIVRCKIWLLEGLIDRHKRTIISIRGHRLHLPIWTERLLQGHDWPSNWLDHLKQRQAYLKYFR